MTARVSVVLPTQNRARLVGRAIASVRRQTATDWELICVDDGSVDQTAAAIEAIDEPRLRLIRLPRSDGLGHARNVAIAAACGGYVAFLDDDNEWTPDALDALLARAATRDGGVPDVVYGLTSRVNDATGRCAAPSCLMPAGDVFRRLVQGWHPMLSAVMVSRAALATARFDEDLRAYADYDLLLRLAAAGARFAGVGRAVLIRHEHHGQRAMTADAERLRAAVDVLDARWRQAIIDRTGRGSYRRWRARFDSAAEFVAVRNAVIRGERWTARRAAVRMARFLPWSVRFPALAAAAALLGPAGYDRLTRARDAMLRYRPG